MVKFFIDNWLTLVLSLSLTISIGFNIKFIRIEYKQKNKFGDNNQIIK